jgi:hypothetical protein
LRPIAILTLCPSSPGSREPILVAIPVNLPRKKEAMVQKAKVNHGKKKMDKTVRRRELPYVRRSSSLCRNRVVRCAEAMPWKNNKKSDEAKKKQRKGKIDSGYIDDRSFPKWRS